MLSDLHVRIVTLVLALLCLASAAVAAPVVMDAYFRADVPFPKYVQYWEDTAVNSGASGGFVHVFVRNTGSEPVEFADALLDGVSLKQGIAFSDLRKYRKFAYAASVYFSKLAQEQKDKLMAAGEPVWYRFEPRKLGPGECGELTIRLRSKTTGEAVGLSLDFGQAGKTEVSVQHAKVTPRFEAISFSFGRDKAYLYVAKSSGGKAPTKVLMDGVDVTSDATIAGPAGSIYPIIVKMKSPLARASWHCFQVVYADAEKATGAVRVFDDDFAYGMWGAAPGKSEDTALAEAYLRGLSDHSINTVMEQIGSAAVRDYMFSEPGLKLMESLGIRRMIAEIGKGAAKNPWSYFLMDEPDAGDSKVEGVPGNKRVGSLGQGLVDRSFEMRQKDPVTPHLLNIDMTYKPQNWYTYAQLPDILTADPYYQVRLAETYWKSPQKRDIYKKAEWVAAVADVCRSAQAPRKLDLVIFTGHLDRKEGKEFRFATPQEKRLEAYYAIGAGAKGISYWWFHSLAQGLPPKKADPLAVAQWREIGLLGAELGTLGPLIMTSCPVDLPVKTTGKLWTRTLMRGDDTIILICVNDDHVNDDKGTKIAPVEKPEITLELPDQLLPLNVFEVGSKGTAELPVGKSPAEWNIYINGKQTLHLGKVDVTRAIVITRDPGLRERLQKLYDNKYAAKVTKLLGSGR